MRILLAHSAHLGASMRDDINHLQRDLQPVIALADFITGILEPTEETAAQYVRENGGEQRVQNVSSAAIHVCIIVSYSTS